MGFLLVLFLAGTGLGRGLLQAVFGVLLIIVAGAMLHS